LKDPEQLELLREFMKLQKDMMIMLLSMLEGIFVSRNVNQCCIFSILWTCIIGTGSLFWRSVIPKICYQVRVRVRVRVRVSMHVFGIADRNSGPESYDCLFVSKPVHSIVRFLWSMYRVAQ